MHPARYALFLLILLNGCASISSQGLLTTKDGQALQVQYKNSTTTLIPGEAKLEFNRRAIFVGDFRLSGNNYQLNLDLPRKSYNENSFKLIGSKNQMNCDLNGAWARRDIGDTYNTYTTESCSDYGYCSKIISVKTCDQNNKNCKTTDEEKYGYYSDCPGRQEIKLTWQEYIIQVLLEFSQNNEVKAKYEGDSEPYHDIVDQEPISPCKLL